MAKKISFSHQHSTLETIQIYYVDSENALNHYFTPARGVEQFYTRFMGYSKREIDVELKTRKRSLDRMCSLETLAAIEARFRIDYLVRCQGKKRDDLSKAFRQIHKRKKARASLTDDIVPTWRRLFPEHKTNLDALNKAIGYRNWLAHGRYWQPKKPRPAFEYDYLGLYSLATIIFNSMDLHET